MCDGGKFALEFVKRVMFFHCAPRQLTHGRDDSHVDSMLGAFAEGRVRMVFVADIQHERRVHYVQVKLFGVDSHVRGDAFHIARDLARIGTVLHKQLTDRQD